jgi:hypothetical protein
MIRLPKWLLIVLALAVVVSLANVAVAADETAKGTIKKVTADKKEFVLTDKDGKDHTFTVDDGAKITVANKESKLTDLKEKQEVTVTYEKKGDKMIAKEIKAEK